MQAIKSKTVLARGQDKDFLFILSVCISVCARACVFMYSSSDELLGPIKIRRKEANGFSFLMMSL